jgi:hypothetical protein
VSQGTDCGETRALLALLAGGMDDRAEREVRDLGPRRRQMLARAAHRLAEMCKTGGTKDPVADMRDQARARRHQGEFPIR